MDEQRTNTNRAAIPTVLSGLVLSIAFTLSRDVSLAEFAWTFWLVGLYSSLIAAGRFAVRTVLYRDSLRKRIPPLSSLEPRALLWVSLAVAVLGGLALAYAFTYVFGFYGIMLSVWVQLQPEALFGRNGFINSDFWTPVLHLTRLYWPLVAGQIISESSALFGRPQPGTESLAPERQIVVLHVFVLALPFVAMLSYAVLGAQYETLSIVLLLIVKSLFDLGRLGGGRRKAGDSSGP